MYFKQPPPPPQFQPIKHYNQKHFPYQPSPGSNAGGSLYIKQVGKDDGKHSKLIDYSYWIANMGPMWFETNMPHTAIINYKHDPDSYLPKFLNDVVNWDKESDGIENVWTWSFIEVPNVDIPALPIKKIKVYAQSEEDLLKIIMFIG